MGITFVARMAMWGAMFGGLGGGNQRNRGNNVIGAIAMMILAPFAALLMQMALSRSHASTKPITAAPSCSARVSRSPRALEKIDAYAKQVPMNVDPAHATAYIVNPLTGRKVNFAGLVPDRTRPRPSASPACGERVSRGSS